MANSASDRQSSGPKFQRGVATLVITLVLLVIITIIVLSSTNVALFEQKTATNENRGRLTEQVAEYAINVSGEYLKANRDRLISNAVDADDVGGWLAPSGASRHWVLCSAAVPFASLAHPCIAEPNNGSFASTSLTQIGGRRAQLYFYTSNGAVGGSTNLYARATTTGAVGFLPTASTLNAVGTAGAFTPTTVVSALLCRLDTSLTTPICQAAPVAGNRIAITLVAQSSLAGENSVSMVKETWGTYSTFSPASSAPLVASGTIQGLGNAQIVTAPNAGGYGIPVSMWSPNNICIGQGASVCTGVGSVSTCHRGEFLKSTPEAELKTTCATVNNACGCPAISAGGTDFLSGHSSSGVKREGLDILDRDGGVGVLPDLLFYPGAGLDDSTIDNDDSLFEWIFGVNYAASEASTNGATLQNCAPVANCAINALQGELNAQSVTCAQLVALGSLASGLYFVTDSSAASICNLPSQIGTPAAPAIVVLNEAAKLNNTTFYGMLFVRSDAGNAELTGVGNTQIFGSVVVEGAVNLAGGFTLVYDDTSVGNSPNDLPKSAKFGRVPGTWLDAQTGF